MSRIVRSLFACVGLFAPIAPITTIATIASAQTIQLPPTSVSGRTPATPVPFAPPKLVNSPSAMTVTQLGLVQQLRVFLDVGGTSTDVTADPLTSYSSSNNAIVAVTSGGLMSFVAQGQAIITTHHVALTDVTHVTIDTNGKVMVETTIGSSGGSLHTADGTGLDIPPGALSTDKTIRIEAKALPGGTTAPHNGALVGQAYDFTPNGLNFHQDVQLALSYDPATLPSGFDKGSIYVAILHADNTLGAELEAGPLGDEDLIETPTLAVDDPAGGRILQPIRHFSERQLVIGKGAVPTTLTAPDGTTLDVLSLIKTQIPTPGADGKFGVKNCDDDNDGKTDNWSEYKGVAGSACTGTIDDVPGPVPHHSLAGIAHIVLHSTASPSVQGFSKLIEVTAGDTCLYWAQYYVGLDGTIVQISTDDVEAQHVKGNLGITNTNSIGIEIFHQTNVENYPGRQIAALVRLCDFLLKANPGVPRPSAANPNGGFITHRDQNDNSGAHKKFDPEQNFRAQLVTDASTGIVHGMGLPCLEDVLMRALRTDTNTGVIDAKGGDAFGTGIPGSGGLVRMELGDPALANTMQDSRLNTQIQTGQTQTVASGNLMSLLVDGTAKFGASSTLDLDGILWVGPNGTLDARGGFDGKDGFSLNFTADGFALIEGRVLVDGTDKLGTTEKPPFNQPPFPASGSGNGNGGNGGSFVFRSAAAGFMWVPSIVTRGGDADSSPAGLPMPGGTGGDVQLRGLADGAGDQVVMLFEGRDNSQKSDQAEVGMPDYLPQPSPFNFMPIVVVSPTHASGTCGVDPFNDGNYIRPASNERLAIGRAIDATTHQALGNVSVFNRGIIACGGIGGASAQVSDLGGDGGRGGAITITNATLGYARFSKNPALFSGAGAEMLASVISVSTCTTSSINKFFVLPSGSLGGRGFFPGGDGGIGGDAGNIFIDTRIWPHIGAKLPPATIGATSINGYDHDNPNFSGGIVLGNLVIYIDEGFTSSSIRGSGGSPAGHASSFPGWFGDFGLDGSTTINGTVFY